MEGQKRKKLLALAPNQSIDERKRLFSESNRTIMKDELDKNTPMWWALRDANLQNCQTTIQKECTKMFWLGYFLRKGC
jgi:hypothetical protein